MDKLIFTYVCHFWKFKNHKRIQVIEYGGVKIQNKSLFATAIYFVRNYWGQPDEKFPWRVTVKCYKTVTIVFRIHRRCQGTESGRSTMPPFFRYLNLPMISEVHKNNMCALFYIIYCCLRLLSWYRQLCSIDITMIAQKLTLRISPPKLPCPRTAPVAAINLKFSGNMPRSVLGKVRKFQDSIFLCTSGIKDSVSQRAARRVEKQNLHCHECIKSFTAWPIWGL